MDLELDYQMALEPGDATAGVPDEAQVAGWVVAALAGHRDEAQLTVRLVGEAEGRELNETYRRKTGPTNVLSFPFEAPPGVEISLLGDIVVCAPVVEREALEQHKALEAHWAHMIVHGCLHLLGHDHIEAGEAEQMESLETGILTGLGYPNPYE